MRARGEASGYRQILTKDGWVDVKNGESTVIDETMLWDEEELKELTTQLHNSGFKPEDASYVEGELTATKKHLEDMRTLVLKDKK